MASRSRQSIRPTWQRFGATLGILIGLLASCTERESPGRSVAREFAAHLCPIHDACPCDQALTNCTETVRARVGNWEELALELGLQLDEPCLDRALDTIDRFAQCGREWFGDCYVYSGNATVGDRCEMVDPVGLMSQCSQGLFCRGGVCTEERQPVLGLGDQCASSPDGIFPIAPNGGVCDESLRCDWMDSMLCIEPGPTGAECVFVTDCPVGDFCRGTSPEVTPTEDEPGVCTTRTKAQGDSCEYVEECLDTLCVADVCQEIPEPTPTPLLCDMIGAIQLSVPEGE